MLRRNRLVVVLAVLLAVAFCLAIYMYYNKFGFFHQTPDLMSYSTAPINKGRLVVVNGISSDHFGELKDFIGSVQQFLPKTPIVIYDLGLKAKQRKKLKRLCNVEVRKFDFAQYPPHFKQLHKYAFKATIIRLLAQEYDYVFWSDASIRLIDNHFMNTLPELDAFPLKGHHHPFKIIQVIHRGTLEYLNVSREMMKGITGISSGLLLFKANKTMKDFLDLWYDCSMHEACIAPEGAVLAPCNYTMVDPDSLEYIGCHHFDQSVLNVLLRREFGKEVFPTLLEGVAEHLQVIRKPSRFYELEICRSK